MIDRQEIMDFSREFSLAPNVIEKDYVLGWMLAGIAAHPEIGQSWVFKGGTCLKKCFFETYRFSEDLDFTLTNPAHLTPRPLIQAIVDAMAPRPGETISDPACGTGGFLLAAHDYVVKHYPNMTSAEKKKLRGESFKGWSKVTDKTVGGVLRHFTL